MKGIWIKKIVKLFLIIILIIAILNILNFAKAVPPISQEFYGVVLLSGTPAPPMSTVDVYVNISENRSLCGSFDVVEAGKYGLLSCMGDDPDTDFIEGSVENQLTEFTITTFNATNDTNGTGNLTFYPITLNATANGNTSWNSAEFHQVNLYANFKMWWLQTNSSNATNVTEEPGFCGDGICNINEDCSVCSLDCGVCPPPGPGGSGGGTKTKGGGGGASNTPPPAEGMAQYFCIEDWVCVDYSLCQPNEEKYRTCKDNANCGTEINKPRSNTSCCYENWDCNEWDECSPLGEQKRTCTDTKECGTTEYKPNETRRCTYPTCNDRIQNGNEGGVDCGGICEPCKGIKYSKPVTIQTLEVGVCGDNVCNINEPCGCPQDCRKFPWFILAIGLLIVITDHYYSKNKWEKIRRNIYEKKMRRLKKVARLKKDSFWFKTIVILASVILSIYIYLFATCPGGFRRYLIILISAALLVPIIAYFILKKFEYSEEEKEVRQEDLTIMHKSQMQKLVDMENKEILRIEKEIVSMINEIKIPMDAELKSNLKQTAYNINLLSQFLEVNEDYIDVESQLCTELESLRALETYGKLAEKDDFKPVDSRLGLLLQHHKDKQELLTEVHKDEQKIEKVEEKVENNTENTENEPKSEEKPKKKEDIIIKN